MRKLIIVIILSLVMCGCSDTKKELDYDIQKNCSDEYETITVNDNQKINFVCMNNVKIKNNNGKLLSIDEYSNDKVLDFINKILPKMTLTETLRDGGTKIYVDKKENVSNEKLVIVMCNSILSDGNINNDIYVGEFNENNIQYCHEKEN